MRDAFPDRFFDTGICESHAVAFAAGQAKTGLRPIVDIYSTFLQRSYDQIFQEVALQNLPVTFMLDRAGLTGPGRADASRRVRHRLHAAVPEHDRDGPGRRSRPGGDARFRLAARRPHVAPLSRRPRPSGSIGTPAPIELGRSEVLEWGHDCMLIACGTLLGDCTRAAAALRSEGLDVGVINARFIKPLDTETILRALETASLVVTVEEGALAGGFGSAVLEAAADAGIAASHVRRLGLPDRSSSTANAANCWPTWGSTRPALPPRYATGPPRRNSSAPTSTGWLSVGRSICVTPVPANGVERHKREHGQNESARLGYPHQAKADPLLIRCHGRTPCRSRCPDHVIRGTVERRPEGVRPLLRLGIGPLNHVATHIVRHKRADCAGVGATSVKAPTAPL